ncbi:LPS export ABC transporter periplasmic protein LptC [Candidatus Pelagibacter sp. HIMB1509]|uniref:LPS export ABC transporter periplasmic protein LptC n=1 Tax=Candidatus Pelagibacter sp. HIMB1509 TaxID=3413339 RepID=UPI003F83D821
MFKKKNVIVFSSLITLIFLAFFVYSKFSQKFKKNFISTQDESLINSNIIKDVNYVTKDEDGNEYIINAEEGEIDFNNENILFLTNVKALIKLKNSDEITIVSDFGKYNSSNFDTIFSKNVIINYLDNKILGEYLDFSIERNSMIISRNVVYSNSENILIADVVEMNLKTKDTKIFMYENEKKVNIRNN